MKLDEMLEQVRVTCRMRRLSRHTENTYAGWIARFAATITSPLDALPQAANVVPFEMETGRRAA